MGSHCQHAGHPAAEDRPFHPPAAGFPHKTVKQCLSPPIHSSSGSTFLTDCPFKLLDTSTYEGPLRIPGSWHEVEQRMSVPLCGLSLGGTVRLIQMSQSTIIKLQSKTVRLTHKKK